MPYVRAPSLGFDPQARYYPTATDRGYLAETYPAHLTINTATPSTAGRLEFTRITLPVAASVTNIVLDVLTVGVTLTTGQCFAALYSGTTVLGQTADQAANWVSTGIKTTAVAGGPFSLAAGNYYIAIWYNGTTSPTWGRTSSISATHTNAGYSAPNLLCGTANTGLTTTAPTMGAQTASSSQFWAALS